MEKSGNDSGERYVVHMDDKFGSLALIDIDAEADAVTVPWFNQTLTTVNKALVRLGVFRGEYHWHKHDEQDEFFLVIDGELHLDVEGREAVVLQKHQGYGSERRRASHARARTLRLRHDRRGGNRANRRLSRSAFFAREEGPENEALFIERTNVRPFKDREKEQ